MLLLSCFYRRVINIQAQPPLTGSKPQSQSICRCLFYLAGMLVRWLLQQNIMKGRKRSSLLDARTQNNLKDMLQYYNDKSYQKTPSVPFEPIYEYDEITTEELILPKPTRDNLVITFPKTNPLQKQHERPEHIDGEAYPQRRSRQSYSRENFAQMNAKLRKIRTSHIRRASVRNKEAADHFHEGRFESAELLTAREALARSNEFISRKMLLSPYGQRAVNLLYQDGSSTSSQNLRPATTLAEESDRNARLKGKGQASRNPHVIYQFQSHLKAKRIDDNPKVLGNIIRKKYTQVGKDELYSYINTLMKRREK